MPDFSSFRDLGQAFAKIAKRADHAIQQELNQQGQVIEARAKALFGTYQAGWPALADSTQEGRSRLGFTPNDPLFRSGGLQGAVSHWVEHGTTRPTLWVGVPDGITLSQPDGKSVQASDVMLWQEFGTARIPPRPVFGLVQHQLADPVHAFGLGYVHRIRL